MASSSSSVWDPDGTATLQQVREELHAFRGIAKELTAALAEIHGHKKVLHAGAVTQQLSLELPDEGEPPPAPTPPRPGSLLRQKTQGSTKALMALGFLASGARARQEEEKRAGDPGERLSGLAQSAGDMVGAAFTQSADALGIHDVRHMLPVSEAHVLRQLWDLVSAFLIIYSLVLAPMDLGFRAYLIGNSTLFSIEVFVDIFFLADVLTNFFTTYIENGTEVRVLTKIWRRYATTWLPIDLVASVPFSFFSLAQGGEDGGGRGSTSSLKALKVLKLFKIGRVFRLKKAAKVLEEVLPATLPPGLFGLFGIIMWQAFFWHILACAYWWVEYELQTRGDWTLSYDEYGVDAGCFRPPALASDPQIYNNLGYGEASKFIDALVSASDPAELTLGMAVWSRHLAGGAYAEATAAAVDVGWDEALAAMPPAFHQLEIAAQLVNVSQIALPAFCAGAVHGPAMMVTVLADAVHDQLSLSEAYSYAFLAMMALSVGEVYGSTGLNSLWFIAFALFISIYFETFVIGYVCNVVDQIDEVGKAQRERMLNVRLFLRMRRVDRKTTRKVMTFLDHTWRMHGGTIPDTKELLEQLPKHLQEDLVTSADRELVRTISDIFHKCKDSLPADAVNDLALTIVMHMKPLVALPDKSRLLQRKGCRVAGLFVIVSGTCLYDPIDGTPPQLLKKGQCFGNELLAHAKPEKRVAGAAVTAREICELMFLSVDEFETLLASEHPDRQPFVAAFQQLWRTNLGARIKAAGEEGARKQSRFNTKTRTGKESAPAGTATRLISGRSNGESPSPSGRNSTNSTSDPSASGRWPTPATADSLQA